MNHILEKGTEDFLDPALEGGDNGNFLRSKNKGKEIQGKQINI